MFAAEPSGVLRSVVRRARSRFRSAPGPFLRGGGEARADGVVEHIAASGAEVGFVLDHPGVEAVSEEVAAACMATVEELSVDAVQPVQTAREAGNRGFEGQGVVGSHEAEGVATPGVTGGGLG